MLVVVVVVVAVVVMVLPVAVVVAPTISPALAVEAPAEVIEHRELESSGAVSLIGRPAYSSNNPLPFDDYLDL